MCVTPIPLKVEDQNTFDKLFEAGVIMQGQTIYVPCNQCIECRRQHIAQWRFRVMQQFKRKNTISAEFVTFTYSDQWLEDADSHLWTETGELTIDYRDFQKFMKRVRKDYNNEKKHPISYLCVGEYGDKTGRPHFHALMFNCPQKLILENWHFGETHHGQVNEATVNYSLKYALKRAGRAHDKNYKEYWYNQVDKALQSELRKTGQRLLYPEAERKLVSKNMGLNYLTPSVVKAYQKDIEKTPILEGGKKISLPRYYKEKIYNENQRITRTKRSIENTPSLSESELREKRAVAQADFIKSQNSAKSRKKTGT